MPKRKPKVLIWVQLDCGYYQARSGASVCHTLPTLAERVERECHKGTNLTFERAAKAIPLRRAKLFASWLDQSKVDVTLEDWTGDEIVELEVPK